MIVEVQYRRQDSESYDDYSWRVCSNKDLEIYDLTWDEVGEILNDQLDEDYTSSRWRKNYQMMKKGFDKANKINLDASEIIDGIEVKKDELFKQQVKTRDKLRELRTDLRNEARIENLKDVFIECAEIVSKKQPIQLKINHTNNGNRVAILQISDWHMGEMVDDFLNTYNEEVFNERIEKLTADTVKYCKLMDVSVLKVLNQGDLMNGNLHVSSRVMAEEDVIYETMHVAEIISKMLLEFAKEVETIEFHSVLDNHSRINKNKKEHIEKESFARFIPWYLKSRLSGVGNLTVVTNRINEVEELNIGLVDIFHEKAFFVHGHEDKVSSVVSDLTLMTKIVPITIFISHLHQNMEQEVHCIDLIMNPSLIGSGQYSKSIRKSSKPRQKLTIYENSNGEVERVSTFFINL